MEDNGCFPFDVTYNIIVRGFLKRNQTYEALGLLEKMLESGFSAANSTIEMLVEVLPTREQDPTLLNMIRKVAPKICKSKLFRYPPQMRFLMLGCD
ncbi:hypothetical protein LguiB_013989 [Lonicera macranthoides]